MNERRALDRFRNWVADDAGHLHPQRYSIVLAAIYVLFCATYIPINMFSVGRRAFVLYLPFEERLPFLPIFEYLYVLTFAVPALLFVSVRSYDRLIRLLVAVGIALVIAYSTYLLFPVYLARPRLVVTSLHTWLLSLQYLDKPYNHFPSMHVTLSWLAVRAADVSERVKVALAVTAAGISISTLFVKQHYVVDIVSGYLLAWGAWKGAMVLVSRGDHRVSLQGRLRAEATTK